MKTLILVTVDDNGDHEFYAPALLHTTARHGSEKAAQLCFASVDATSETATWELRTCRFRPDGTVDTSETAVVVSGSIEKCVRALHQIVRGTPHLGARLAKSDRGLAGAVTDNAMVAAGAWSCIATTDGGIIEVGDVSTVIADHHATISTGAASRVETGRDCNIAGGDSMVVHTESFSNVTVGSFSTVTVGSWTKVRGGQDLTVTAAHHAVVTAGTASCVTVGRYSSVVADRSASVTAGRNASVTVGDDCTIVAAANSYIRCGDRCSIVAGANSVVFCGDGCTVTAARGVHVTFTGAIETRRRRRYATWQTFNHLASVRFPLLRATPKIANPH